MDRWTQCVQIGKHSLRPGRFLVFARLILRSLRCLHHDFFIICWRVSWLGIRDNGRAALKHKRQKSQSYFRTEKILEFSSLQIPPPSCNVEINLIKSDFRRRRSKQSSQTQLSKYSRFNSCNIGLSEAQVTKKPSTFPNPSFSENLNHSISLRRRKSGLRASSA